VSETERRTRLLSAHAQLFGEVLAGDSSDRLPKLANILGGLATANEAEILRTPAPQVNSVGGSLRLAQSEYALDLRWAGADAQQALEEARRHPEGASISRTLLFIVEGVPQKFKLHPEHDADTIVIDGRDLALLLEGRWALQQAVQFKQREQRDSGRFVQLPVTPPVEAAETAPRPPEHTAAPSATQGPSAEDIPGGELLSSNIDDFTLTAAQQEAEAASEERRLRLWRWAVLGVVVLGILIAVLVVRGNQSAQSAALQDAERTAVAALRFKDDAFRRLDATGAGQYFTDGPAGGLVQGVEALRAQGIFETGERSYGLLDSRIEGDVAVVVLRESGQAERRSLETGQLLASRASSVTWALRLAKTSENDRWLVSDLRVVDGG
jgi:hypothetical protein